MREHLDRVRRLVIVGRGGREQGAERLGRLASHLVRRRDGDPRGEIAQPRSQLVWAEAVSDEELRFELRETLFTASSQTSAVPTSRSVEALQV